MLLADYDPWGSAENPTLQINWTFQATSAFSGGDGILF